MKNKKTRKKCFSDDDYETFRTHTRARTHGRVNFYIDIVSTTDFLDFLFIVCFNYRWVGTWQSRFCFRDAGYRPRDKLCHTSRINYDNVEQDFLRDGGEQILIYEQARVEPRQRGRL